MVAGEIVRDPARDVSESDEISVDGQRVGGVERRVVYAVNKPVGVLSTASDPFGRPTVVELIPGEGRRLYPIGRLDLDSEGLILLSNDGELAHALTHPRFGVEKSYVVEVLGGPVGLDALQRLRTGVRLDDGMTRPAQVEVLDGRGGSQASGRDGAHGSGRGGPQASRRDAPRRDAPRRRDAPSGRDGTRTRLRITIHEGRNRQVRRMCDSVGHEVRRLKRVSFGPLQLGDLRPGAHRRLSEDEVEALRAAAAAQPREPM